jgi:SAM-dependent methyltransferase
MKRGAWFVGLVSVGITANALRLRRKAVQLQPLPNDSSPDSAPSYDLVTGEGVEVPPTVRDAAADYAERNALGILDLVPEDLPVEQALDLLRFLNLDTYRNSPLAMGRGAGHTILADAELLKRSATDNRTDLQPGEMAEATLQLRQYANNADLVVAPFKAQQAYGRRAWLTALSVTMRQTYATPMVLTGSALSYTAVLGCLALNPALGLIPLALYCAAPYIVFTNTAIKPRDLHRAALLRLAETPLSWWQTVRAPRDRWEQRNEAQLTSSRTWHEEQLAQGTARFFQERRKSCPWCSSSALRTHIKLRDRVHLKPGKFTMARCKDCGHVFLNPGLSQAGLDFYYRDVYDGLGGPDMNNVLAGQRDTYLARAHLVRDALAGEAANRWLDVGTGSAHFPRMAREAFPATEFHGLDMGSSVLDAKRRGWIEEAYRGLFPQLAEKLAGQYDVVSMNHYLEHTLDPQLELDAAAKALRPGGHLLIEVPDPECSYGRLLRSYWIAWLAPEHLNFVPLGNLERALEERGFAVVARVRRAARQGPDLAHGAAAFLNALWGPTDRPWSNPRPLTVTLARRACVIVSAVPLMLAAIAAEPVTLPFMGDRSNAYRIVARRVPTEPFSSCPAKSPQGPDSPVRPCRSPWWADLPGRARLLDGPS